MTSDEIQKAIHGNNILWRCAFTDELVTNPRYDLTYTFGVDVNFMSCAQRVDLTEKSIESEIAHIEKFYRSRNKNPSFYLDPSSRPQNIEEILLAKGYIEYTAEEEVWWYIPIDKLANVVITDNLVIKECNTRELFEDHLLAAMEGYKDFKFWASLLSKSFRKSIDGVDVTHFVAYIDAKPVACASLGIYFDYAYLINVAVVPEYRRKGIHTSLMYYRMMYARERGVAFAFYQTDFDNEASIATGKKVGFKEAFRRRLFTKDLLPHVQPVS